jgi:hypothetical protein
VCVQAAVAYTRAARRRLRVITAFLNTEAVVALMLKQASAPVVLKCCMLQVRVRVRVRGAARAAVLTRASVRRSR